MSSLTQGDAGAFGAADPAVIADARRRQRRRRIALTGLALLAAALVVVAVRLATRGGDSAAPPAASTGLAHVPLIGLTFTSFNAPVTLQHVAPRTLSPEGAKLRLAGPGGNQGIQWAHRGNLFAFEVYGANRESTPIRLVNAANLRVLSSVPVGHRDVCALSFDGPTLVALTAVPWCNAAPNASTAFSLLRINVASGQVAHVVPVAGLKPFLYPVSLAFGDGHAYVARANGTVETLDLRTGVLRVRKPRRTLAKATDGVYARWLGNHLLGLGPRLVDVRTWRARLLTPNAQKLTSGGVYIVAFGSDGATVFSRTGKFRFRILTGENIRDAHVVGDYLYADADTDTEVLNLRTRKRISVVPHANAWSLLAP